MPSSALLPVGKKVLGLDTAKLFAPAVGGQKFSVVGKDTGTKGRPLSALVG